MRLASPTFGRKIDEAGGFTSGFDYMRLVLSLLVLIWHSFVVSGDRREQAILPFNGFMVLFALVLPMFFALSGFLVAASLLRTPSILKFLGLRAIRLVPGLSVEVVLSALIIGPLVTSVSLGRYFTDPALFKYALNAVGYIHFTLPGVFLENPHPNRVNGSLWTVPFEAECYLLFAAMALVGLARNRVALAIVLGLLLALALAVHSLAPGSALFSTGRLLMLCFISGTVLYMFRDHVPHTPLVAVPMGLLALVLLNVPALLPLAPLPVAYFTAWLGLFSPRKVGPLRAGDYSYGIYLYHAPIEQTVAYAFDLGRLWWGNLLIAGPAAFAVAALSWHGVERPALRLKRLLLKDRRRGPQEMISPDAPAVTDPAAAEAMAGRR